MWSDDNDFRMIQLDFTWLRLLKVLLWWRKNSGIMPLIAVMDVAGTFGLPQISEQSQVDDDACAQHPIMSMSTRTRKLS
jgi:hypothetical protein